VDEVGGQAWAAGIMEIKGCVEGLLIANIEEIGSFMQELEPVNKGLWSTKGGDQIGHIVGGEEGVEPDAGFICLRHNYVRPAMLRSGGKRSILPHARSATRSNQCPRT
jgi:hypothetical protein